MSVDDKVKKSGKPIKIDSAVKIKSIESKVNAKYKCTCCGKEYSTQRGNFFISNSVLYAGNDGYLTICKECAERYYLQMVGLFSGNEEHAIERCCQLFDWFYSPEVSAMIKSGNLGGRTKINAYPQKMGLLQIKQKGTTYVDTLKYRERNVIMDDSDVNHKRIEKNDNDSIDIGEGDGNNLVSPATVNISPETIKFFGYGYSPQEYEYLDDQYGDWCARYECKTKAQEELFKSLCIAQLTIQRVQKRGSAKEISDAMKTFQDLLGTANLKPSQTNDNVLADQNTFGTLIKKWENERPISEPREEWKDVDNIAKYIDTFFLGHLCNLVHVKNDKEAEYRAEMEKYTVKPPVYEEDELGETSLLDRFSDKDKGDIADDSP